jgi:hypothetical protein
LLDLSVAALLVVWRLLIAVRLKDLKDHSVVVVFAAIAPLMVFDALPVRGFSVGDAAATKRQAAVFGGALCFHHRQTEEQGDSRSATRGAVGCHEKQPLEFSVTPLEVFTLRIDGMPRSSHASLR